MGESLDIPITSFKHSRRMHPESLACPNCDAPLSVDDPQQKLVICLYCDFSVRLHTAGAPKEEKLSTHDIPQEMVARIKQMVLDGKREEAIQLYAQLTGEDRADAEKAINQLVFMLSHRLSRRTPFHLPGIALELAIFALLTGGAVWGINAAFHRHWAFALLAALGLVAILRIRSLVPHIVSTMVFRRGSRGKARVVRRAIIRPGFRKDATLLVALLDVQPDDGSPPFRDEETLLVLDHSVERLVPGNTILVRFDRSRALVFPISPIQVVEPAGGAKG